jgi:O-antigen biosynthesis protein
MYGEDLDLCYRIQEAGYKVFYVHSTQVIHYKGESTRRSSIDETKVFYDAMNLFVKKHLSSSLLVSIIIRIAIAFRKLFAFVGKRKLVVFPIIIDVFLFNVCLFTAEKIYMSLTDWQGFVPSAYYIIYSVPAFIHIMIAYLFGVYRKDSLSVLRNIGAIAVSVIVITSITFFFKQYAFSRAVVIISYSMFFIITVLWRVIAKLFFKIGINTGGFISKCSLVVGTEDEAIHIANKLKTQKTRFTGILVLSENPVRTSEKQ